jgi:hypothetical protein
VNNESVGETYNTADDGEAEGDDNDDEDDEEGEEANIEHGPHFALKECFKNHNLQFQTFFDQHKPIQTSEP